MGFFVWFVCADVQMQAGEHRGLAASSRTGGVTEEHSPVPAEISLIGNGCFLQTRFLVSHLACK